MHSYGSTLLVIGVGVGDAEVGTSAVGDVGEVGVGGLGG